MKGNYCVNWYIIDIIIMVELLNNLLLLNIFMIISLLLSVKRF